MALQLGLYCGIYSGWKRNTRAGERAPEKKKSCKNVTLTRHILLLYYLAHSAETIKRKFMLCVNLFMGGLGGLGGLWNFMGESYY